MQRKHTKYGLKFAKTDFFSGLGKNKGGGAVKVRLNVAKPGVKIGANLPLHTVCGMGTILFVACAPATNRAFLHPTSAPSAFQFMPPPQRTCQELHLLPKSCKKSEKMR